MANLGFSIKIAVDFVTTWSLPRVQALEEGQREHRLETEDSEDLLQLYHMLWFTFLSLSNPRFEILPSPSPSITVSPVQPGNGVNRDKNRRKKANKPYARPIGGMGIRCPVPLCYSRKQFSQEGVIDHA